MKTERVEPLLFVTCGGTIDKVYFDAKSEFEVGSPQVAGLLEEANVGVPCRILPVLRKDSLEMTEADREAIRDAIASQPERLVVVTHGPLLLLSAATGGVLLLAADVAARSVIAPQELPVGLLTAVLGGLYLLVLLRRRQRGAP
jgi:hypothetical protein